MRLANILRRALGRQLPLRLGALQWVGRDRLRVGLHEPGDRVECAELEVSFALTGVPGQEVLVRLEDISGDPDAAGWPDRNADLLIDIWDQHLGDNPTSARGAWA